MAGPGGHSGYTPANSKKERLSCLSTLFVNPFIGVKKMLVALKSEILTHGTPRRMVSSNISRTSLSISSSRNVAFIFFFGDQ
jgi:hypothetical protein